MNYRAVRTLCCLLLLSEPDFHLTYASFPCLIGPSMAHCRAALTRVNEEPRGEGTKGHAIRVFDRQSWRKRLPLPANSPLARPMAIPS